MNQRLINMDVEKLFHMAGGNGPTSYARNSSLQKRASESVKHIILQALQQLYIDTNPKTINIADLGCSSGPNTLAIIKDIIETVEETSREILHNRAPEFHVYLNDLPTNDFNSLFKALPDCHRQLRNERDGRSPSVYVAGYPGSFYGRLFPSNSLHFIHSSNSLHWLSKVPSALYNDKGESINKGNVYISESSPAVVSHAYFKQFQDDFSLFLRSRSEELVVGGRMVLILLGRIGPDHVDRGNSFFWELLSRSLAILVAQGEIEKEKLDAYHAHFYAPSREEIEDEVVRECSFELDKLEMVQIEREGHNHHGESYGSAVARTVRAIQESTIIHHFGIGERVLDTLFEIYGRFVDEQMAKKEIKPLTFVVLLRKL